MEKITSRANPLMTHIRKLSSAAYRRETGEYLCDSPKLLAEAVQWGAEIVTVVATAEAELPALPAAVRCVEVPRDVMESISPMKTPQGVLFTCRLPETVLPAKPEGKRYMVLDGVQDPGNVGTIWRTADAFGCDGLILLPGCADPYSAKTVRSSMGAVFRLPVYTATAAEMKEALNAAQIPLYGAALRDDTLDARDVDYTRAAIAIGSEGRGLTEEVLTLCDRTVRIPMAERCESLNAAIAATVLLWEAYR
ncbi:MAG: RNA methyltransferase [Oscillospiraceae bacterium]|nr:RNA methyltransferase [Oscillospiraceae bacterium]